MDVITSFWRELLSSSVTSLVQCADQPSLRAAACDCLAIIGVNVFEKLTVSSYFSSLKCLLPCLCLNCFYVPLCSSPSSKFLALHFYLDVLMMKKV